MPTMPAQDVGNFPPPIPTVDWGFWLTNDTVGIPWYEEIADVSPNDGKVSPQQTTETITIVVNWADESLAAVNLVGYQTVGSTTIGDSTYPVINRMIPKTHPQKQWLYAVNVAIKRYAPLHGFAETEFTSGSDTTIVVGFTAGFYTNQAIVIGYGTAEAEANVVAEVTGPTGLNLVAPLLNGHSEGDIVRGSNTMVPFPQGGSDSTSIYYMAGYIVSKLTITFASLPYTVIDDADLQALTPGALPDELSRYCQFNGIENGDFLTRQRNSFFWAETSLGGPVTGSGSPVDASIGQRLIKPTMVITWFRVPTEFIFNDDFVPTNFRACEGTLNDDTFMGRLPGTLLCLPVKYEPHESPANPEFLGLLPGYPPREWTVTASFAEFNPVNGNATSTFAGWNLQPFPGNNLWYLVSTSGTDTGTFQYESSNFQTIFQGVTS